ncbi:site-specific integrase [Staphylococcus gallinarum]|uniref:site-specific integrase n=1 Tax=Staphylococcus gallinarum TaxID=1293 RepID=UPI000D1C25F6|nr:site-specific integrase [Staphylococcus gallinarum]PTE73175.1 site-specific integrase [Staphylococcus gallinarum]
MSVSKRGKTWQYYFGHEGKRYRQSGFKTKKDAQEAETIARNKLLKGVMVNNKSSFIDYYVQWVDLNKKDVISESGYKNYIYAINNFKKFLDVENIKDVKMDELTTTIYRKFLKWYGANHTTESVRKTNNCLKASIKDAIEEGLIHKNPTYKAVAKGKVPAKKEEDKFMSVYNFEQLKTQVKNSNSQSSLFLFILIITGARFSEVQKLKNKDLNFKNNTIHLPGTKTDIADRIVDVNQNDMKHIKNILSNTPIKISGYIFHTGNNLLTHTAVNKVLKKYCDKNNMPKYTCHVLRHTHCSYLLHKGVSIYYISKRLGHKNTQITIGVYSHLLDEVEEAERNKAIEALNF